MGAMVANVLAGMGEHEPMRNPIRILYTIPNFITAGSGSAMLNIIKHLDRDRFSPAVAVLKKGGNLDAKVELLGIPLIEAPFTIHPRPYVSLLARARSAGAVFRPYRFDLWHSFHYTDDYTEPLIARMSGARHWIYTKKNMNWHHRSWTLRTALASRVAAQNMDMMRDFFTTGGFARKTRLIPRGVDTVQFSPMARPDLKLREQLHIPPQTIVITCVAQLVAVKDHPNLLRALGLVPAVHLLLAGSTTDNEYIHKLKALTAALAITDRVHFLGSVTNIPALLTESDIFILPTVGKGEGCPVALLEAMACAKPCIATDIPGSRDLIVSGESGILVPPSNPEALAMAIQTLIDSPDLRWRYAQNARQRVEQHFTIEQEVKAHEALYAELLDC